MNVTLKFAPKGKKWLNLSMFGGNIWMPKMHQKPFKNIANLDGCPYRFAGIIVLPWRKKQIFVDMVWHMEFQDFFYIPKIHVDSIVSTW